MVKYLIIFEKTKTGYSAYVPDLSGCVATAKNRDAVEKKIIEAIQFHLDGLKKENIKIPVPKIDAEKYIFAV